MLFEFILEPSRDLIVRHFIFTASVGIFPKGV
jgi:hypothetical protein